MRRIAIAAAKGGTGKTTTAVSLAHGLALAGRRVLLVDCDPKRQASTYFGVPEGTGVAGLLQGLAAEAVTVRERLRVLDSGGAALAEAEIQLAARPAAIERLRQVLAGLQDGDYVFFDCPPSLGLAHLGALAACDEIILPVGADFLALAGARQTLAVIRALPQRSGTRPRLLGLLRTFCDPDAGSDASYEAALRQEYSGQVLQTRIRTSEGLRLAPAGRHTIFEAAPLSPGALDYALLTEEIEDLAA